MENIRAGAAESDWHVVGAWLVLAESQVFIVIRPGPG